MTARVMVTGTGILTSAGAGLDALRSVLREGRQGEVSSRTYEMQGESVIFPKLAIPEMHACSRMQGQDISWLEAAGLSGDQDFLYLLDVISQTMNRAGIDGKRSKVSLIIGHENLGVVRLVDKLLASAAGEGEKAAGGLSFADMKNEFFHLQSFTYLFYLSRLFHIRGFTSTVNNACASGLYALEIGRQLIESGQSDAVVVACSDYAHLSEFMWLKERGLISPSSSHRAFDKNRDGSVLGDGAAAMLLESSSHMRSRGAEPLCEYMGGAFMQEGWQMTLPDAGSHTYAAVIKEAAGKLRSGTVDALVPHGTGSPLWDRYEAREIKQAFSDMQTVLPDITAFKGYVGHTLGASALLEAVLLIHAMREGCLPAAAGFTEEDPLIDLPVAQAPVRKQISSVIKSVPAYGGFYAAAAFEAP